MAGIKVERTLSVFQASAGGEPDSRRLPPDWSTLREQVRDADQGGYDAVVAPELINDPYLMIAIAAQEPSHVELVTGIALALNRSPTATAYTAWDLQRMSGGRFVLGLGSQVKGHVERRFSMPFSKPALRMKEYVQVLRACWRSWQEDTDVDFEGECYRVTFMPPHMRSRPPQDHPHIPVQIAAVGPLMLQVAGEVCDGVRLHDFATRKYIDEIALPNLRKGFARSGRPDSEWSRFEISGGGVILTGPDDGTVARQIEAYRRRAALYASTKAYRDVMAGEGWGDVADRLNALVRSHRWGEMTALITEEMVRRIACVGRHDEIADVIADRLAGVNRVRLNLPARSDRERGASREIIQAIKAKVRPA